MSKSALFLFTALFLLPALILAQSRDDDARDDLDYYSSRDERARDNRGGDIWWGTGAQLGFGATSFSSQFIVGLSPIVGYKLNEIFSVGPRAGAFYNRIRDDRFGLREGFFEWEVGAFGRAKVFRQFFAHIEYNLLSEVDYFTGPQGLEEVRRSRFVPFLGGGINQGGGPGQSGFEFMVLFRLVQPEVINDQPFIIRSGINFNF